MNRERLTTLANHLRTVPPEKLDMEDWACGTAACAVGHACTMPEFNAQGFRFNRPKHDMQNPYPVYDTVPVKLTSWAAVLEFFDVLDPASRHLFESGDYLKRPTPNEVADRIDDFVEHDGAVNIHGELV